MIETSTSVSPAQASAAVTLGLATYAPTREPASQEIEAFAGTPVSTGLVPSARVAGSAVRVDETTSPPTLWKVVALPPMVVKLTRLAASPQLAAFGRTMNSMSASAAAEPLP